MLDDTKKVNQSINDNFNKNKIYKGLINILDNLLNGHISIGKRITIYGRNSMHWAVNIRTKRFGYICFRLPFTCFGKWFPLYFYFSPNATPWAATFMIGKAYDREDWALSRIRRIKLGHNFKYDSENDENGNYAELRRINDKLI